jgi:hypothetical protein
MDEEKYLRKYKNVVQFREYTKNECLKKTDNFEKDSCNHIFEIIDAECKRMENKMKAKSILNNK